MNNQEYEQKKCECWEEAVLHGALEVDKDLLFGHAFKCGYDLGKQEKDGIDLEKLDKMLDDALEKETKESLNQWLSAKDADIVISGWAARDKDNALRLHYDKPKRMDGGYWQGGFKSSYLPKNEVPDLTWGSEPQECEIIIKRKNESR